MPSVGVSAVGVSAAGVAAAANPASGANVLTFRVASEAFAIAAEMVSEIVRTPALTRVPHGPPSLLGVANLRGAVLPVVSLARLLGHDAGVPAAGSRVLIVAGDAKVGLLVDAVAAFTTAGDGKLIDPAALLAQAFGGLLRRSGSDATAGIAARVGPASVLQDHRHDEIALIGLRLGSQEYALPLDKVAEVMRLPATLAEVPRTDDAMMGVTSLRGVLLPLVSLRVLLGLPPDACNRATTRIVVTRLGNVAAGLVVDAVTATLTVSAGSIDPVPPVLMRGKGEAQVEGICRLEGGRRLVCLLSPARLLDPATAALIQTQGEQEASRMPAPEAHSDTTEQFLIFQLGDEQYGLPIAAVDEVVRRPDALTRLPRAPDFVDGVMNLRGRAVPVIDQRRRFAVAAPGTRGRRVIVVTVDGLQAGFAVDAVSEVLRVPSSELRQAPVLDADGAPVFDRVAIRTGGRVLLLISPKALLDQAERDLLVSLTETATAP